MYKGIQFVRWLLQRRPLKADQEVSNTNHFGSVSESWPTREHLKLPCAIVSTRGVKFMVSHCNLYYAYIMIYTLGLYYVV